MKLQIDLSDMYAQQMLQDNRFRASVNFNENIDLFISQVWVENTVINNDEGTFRVQTLNMIAEHFCRIFDVQASNVQVAYNESQIPDLLLRLNTSEENREIASILTI